MNIKLFICFALLWQLASAICENVVAENTVGQLIEARTRYCQTFLIIFRSAHIYLSELKKMGIYDEEVTKKVGKDELDLILEAVIACQIDNTKMQDIAQKLDVKVGGSHRRRGGSDEDEMRNIFSDWYQNVIYKHEWERVTILTEIIKILKDPSVSLNPLAGKLEQCLVVTKVIGQDAWDIICAAVRADIIDRRRLRIMNRSLKTNVSGIHEKKPRDSMREILCGWRSKNSAEGDAALCIVIKAFQEAISPQEVAKISQTLQKLEECKTLEEFKGPEESLSVQGSELDQEKPIEVVLDEEIEGRTAEGENGRFRKIAF